MLSNLRRGRGKPLWDYFRQGPGAGWIASPTPWRTLRAELAKHVPAEQVNGLATNLYVSVFGHGPSAGKKRKK